MKRWVSIAVCWDSNVKGNRERNGFHRQTEDMRAGLVLGRLAFWVEAAVDRG